MEKQGNNIFAMVYVRDNRGGCGIGSGRMIVLGLYLKVEPTGLYLSYKPTHQVTCIINLRHACVKE